MKKFALSLLAGSIVTSFVFYFGAGEAISRPQYNKEFQARFVKADSTNPEEKAFAEAVATAKCNVCHEGESKKNRNAFGKELAKLFTPPNEKDTKKIDEAFDKVLKMHVDAKDDKSPTYEDLMKKGKLWVEAKPAGDKK
jgi:hypothetical protein